MKRIVLASNNKHKVSEIKAIFNEYEILTMNDIEYYDDIVEDGETFFDNALIKASKSTESLKEIEKLFAEVHDLSGVFLAQESAVRSEGIAVDIAGTADGKGTGRAVNGRQGQIRSGDARRQTCGFRIRV